MIRFAGRLARWRRAALVLGAALLLSAGAHAQHKPPAPHQAHQPPQAAKSAQPTIKLEVQPAALTLDPSQPARGRLLVVAHNADPAVLTTARLTWLTPAGLTATIIDAPAAFAGDLAWTVEVTADQTIVSPAAIAFTLSYAAPGRTAPLAITSVAGSVTIPPPVSATLLKPGLVPAEGSAEENAPLHLELQIDNPGRQTAAIRNVHVIAPDRYVCLADPIGRNCLGKPPPDGAIQPGGTLALPLTLRPKAALPGSYPLVIGFDAKLEGAPPGWQPLTAQGKISLEVRGVSDALQLVGIPSLLLLPGVLTILTALAVWGVLVEQKAIDLKQTPMLLVGAVVLSFGAGLVYPWATQWWFGVSRDYLAGYDMRDVVFVWTGSMTVGLIIGGVPGIVVWAKREWQACLQKREPNPADTPLAVLEKLMLHNAALGMPIWRCTDPAAPPQFFLELPFGTAQPGHQWLVQRARLAAGPGQAAQDRLARIRQIITAAAPSVAALLDEVKAAGDDIILRWEVDAGQGPRELPTATYRPDAGTRCFIIAGP